MDSLQVFLSLIERQADEKGFAEVLSCNTLILLLHIVLVELIMSQCCLQLLSELHEVLDSECLLVLEKLLHDFHVCSLEVFLCSRDETGIWNETLIRLLLSEKCLLSQLSECL